MYNSTVLREIIQRNNVSDVDLINKIMKVIMENIGQHLSANKIYTSEEIIKNEFKPLKKIEDNYPKYVIT